MNSAEPGDIETLNLTVANPKEFNRVEYIRLGVVDEDVRETGRVSFAMVQFSRDTYALTYCQSFLTVDELDEIIVAIQEAKARVERIRAGEVR